MDEHQPLAAPVEGGVADEVPDSVLLVQAVEVAVSAVYARQLEASAQRNRVPKDA